MKRRSRSSGRTIRSTFPTLETQVNAVMPFDLDGQGDIPSEVEAGGQRSPVLRNRIGLYGPAFFPIPAKAGAGVMPPC